MNTGEVKNLTKGTSLTGEAWAEDTPPMQILRAGGFYPYVRKMIQEGDCPSPSARVSGRLPCEGSASSPTKERGPVLRGQAGDLPFARVTPM